MARGYSIIALDNPKNAVNVGSAIRAASCYGCASLVTSGRRIRSCTDTHKSYRHMPIHHGIDDVMSLIPFDCVPVAVELTDDAESLVSFRHPERAFYVFGAEDATLGARITDRCKHVVYVPTRECMNLAATVNVVLYDRLANQLTKKGEDQ